MNMEQGLCKPKWEMVCFLEGSNQEIMSAFQSGCSLGADGKDFLYCSLNLVEVDLVMTRLYRIVLRLILGTTTCHCDSPLPEFGFEFSYICFESGCRCKQCWMSLSSRWQWAHREYDAMSFKDLKGNASNLHPGWFPCSWPFLLPLPV